MRKTVTQFICLLFFLASFGETLTAKNLTTIPNDENITLETKAVTTDACACSSQELTNGSFETTKRVNGVDVPTDWNYSGNFRMTQDYDVCGTDNGLLTGAGSFWQDVENVVPGSLVTLNIWGGYHNKNGQFFKLIFLGKNGEELLVKEKELVKSVSQTGGILTKYTLSGTAPAGTLVIRVKGVATGDYFKVDAACLSIEKPAFDCKSCTANKLVNPSFETTKISGQKEVPTDWVGVNFIKDAGFVVCDSKNGLVDNGAGSFYQDVRTTPLSKVTLKIWAGYHVFDDHKLELIFFSETSTKALATTTVYLDKSVEDLKNKLKQYTLMATAPAGTAYVRVKGSAGGNYFKVDAACLTIEEPAQCVACTGNKLTNPSFETTTGWTKSNSGTFTTSDQYVVCGSKSGFVSGATTITQDIQNVNEGSDVTLTIWGAYKAASSQKFSLYFYNAQNAMIGSQGATVNQNLTDNVEGLKQYTVTQKAPKGSKFVRVEISSGGSEFRFDNACLTITAGSLPVVLTDLKVVKAESSAKITWSTVSETNSREFEVQQSTTGNDWTTLGSVAAKGESKVTEDYEYIHLSPVAGNNLYRLKMIDADNTYSFSRIVSVKFENLSAVSVYPNPATDHIKVNAGTDQLSSVRIYNVGGVLVKDVTPASGSEVNLTGLAQGAYIVKINHLSGLTTTKRIQVVK
ncbi:T9SS type A sorting domain-containing protein [Dyadobacter psychrotolerans]|uniref:T9SS type A sorting domain-containing protein n=1 Tax=Dyadobacter psychrotolerans TaxID=2541721 RepID=A0A4R5E1F7_9BACT|nr:T9SS type A sorting domain-containing protein [Dyadobacter psychrotolerans]TDE18521.1 T9SS type A sorting domain-containing protein [Dyadobacter psychrotolerans]